MRCSKARQGPLHNLHNAIIGSQNHIETKQQSSRQQRRDDATGSSAICGGQAAVLGGVLRRGAREGLQASQDHAGSRQAVLHVRGAQRALAFASFRL